MLGHRFAAESARERANGCTYHGAYRSDSDRARRSTGSDTASRRSKADSYIQCHAYRHAMLTVQR